MVIAYSTHRRFQDHDLPGHPEHAGRIRAVWQALDQYRLTERMSALDVQPVTDEQILWVHTPTYLNLLKRTAQMTETVRIDADTYANPQSFEIARLSAGAVTGTIDAVTRGQAANGLAAVRPPGHHAIPEMAMGFCLLGNIAIGARHAQHRHGIKRVLIVDYDVHHGNGTEAVFYDDSSVLFISTHQALNPYGGRFYPGTGGIHDIGEGRGSGFTINIPLAPGHGDANYAALYEQIVIPAATRFQPDLILVSAGFDAHWQDPLASMRLSLRGYARLTQMLVQLAAELCGGRIVFVMEGGYDLGVLSSGIVNIAHILLGDETIIDPFGATDDDLHEPDIQPTIARLKQIHQLG